MITSGLALICSSWKGVPASEIAVPQTINCYSNVTSKGNAAPFLQAAGLCECQKSDLIRKARALRGMPQSPILVQVQQNIFREEDVSPSLLEEDMESIWAGKSGNPTGCP